MDERKSPCTQRKQRTARKIDREKVMELHERGLQVADIATHQGVAPSTVWRFLASTSEETQALKEYVSGRAQVFQRLQAKSLDLQHRVLDTFDDGILKAMTVHQKTGLVSVLSAQTGTLYDKERLESGKSTQNVGLVARIMGEALKTVFVSADPLQEREASHEAKEGDHDGTPF